uniref:Putative reverse transcriptase domain-containing protein n=1 Tax=Tanacetum cinerariifolium TaxID=118510 RepID=A0A6L2KXK2_TANCI|nr:putative reverse transcriptase domain-containing protein [Tanacetum cinerariifolium]
MWNQNQRDLPKDIPLDSAAVLRSILTDSKVNPTTRQRSVKVKELQERYTIKAFKLSNQERIPLLDYKVLRVLREKHEEKMRKFMSVKAKEKEQEEIVVVRDFPEVFLENLSGLPSYRDNSRNSRTKVSFDQALHLEEHRTQEEHKMHLGIVLKFLKKEKMYAKFSMCEFWLREVQFLGHVINGKGIHVDPSKIDTVKNWEAPRTPSEVYLFLGLPGYYCRFIENFSKIAKPLNVLTQKSKTFDWGEEQENAFQTLKDKLCNAPVLALTGGLKDFVVYCDASSLGLGCVLMQRSKVKPKHQRPSGMLQQPEILEWKWEGIAKDFVTKLPRTSSGHDTIWVIVDRLTKSAHFLPMHEDYKIDRLARLYLNDIVARHGVPILIISDRDGRFTSRFWSSMQEALGTRLDIRPELVQKTTDKISQIKDRIKATRDRQKSYDDKRRKPLEFSIGDHVLLKVLPWKGVEPEEDFRPWTHAPRALISAIHYFPIIDLNLWSLDA